MKISLNKTFASRQELDTYVKNTFGENAEKNREIVLEDTPEALKALALSEDVSVFGVKISAIEPELMADPNVGISNDPVL